MNLCFIKDFYQHLTEEPLSWTCFLYHCISMENMQLFIVNKCRLRMFNVWFTAAVILELVYEDQENFGRWCNKVSKVTCKEITSLLSNSFYYIVDQDRVPDLILSRQLTAYRHKREHAWTRWRSILRDKDHGSPNLLTIYLVITRYTLIVVVY